MAVGGAGERRHSKRLHEKGVAEAVDTFTYAPRLSLFKKAPARRGQLADVSTLGVSFTTHEVLPLGSRMVVTLHFSSRAGFATIPAPVSAEVTVIRCKAMDGGHYLIAARFEKVNSKSLKELETIIDLATSRGMK